MVEVPGNNEKIGLPEHIAVIMDGNGRWAESKGLGRRQGHTEGAKALERLVECASKKGIKYLTVYAFSTENWQRPKAEISALMQLLEKYLKDCLKKSSDADNNICYRFIGDISRLSADLQENIIKLQNATLSKKGLCLNVALNYGGRQEITLATRNIAKDVSAGKIKPGDINEELFAKYLYNSDIPCPDLLIRTSGEKRISNFLLWQLAYTEMLFLDVLWPDFSADDFEYALSEYGKRKRRFGGI